MARSGIFVVVVFLLIGTVLALEGPSGYFAQSDIAPIKEFVLSSQQQDGSFGSIQDTYYAVSTLKRLGADVPKAKDVAALAKSSIKGGSLSDIYHAASILATLGETIPSEAFTAAAEILDKTDEAELEDLSYSALILSQQKPANKKIASLADRIAGLSDSDGTFKKDELDVGTLDNARLALKALAAIPTETLTALEKLSIDEAAGKIADLFALASEVDGALSFSEPKVSPLKTTGGIIESANLLAAKNPKAREYITAAQTSKIAEYFVRSKVPHNLEDAYYLVAGVTSLTNGNLHSPVVLSVVEGALSTATSNKKSDFTFAVTDLLGKPISSKVFLIKAYNTLDSSKVILRNQELGAEANTYKLNFLAAKPEAGFYTLELSAAPSAKGNFITIDQATRKVKVLTTVDFSDGELALFDPAEELPLNKISVDSGSPKGLKLTQEQKIHFTFKLKNQQSGKLIRPQQVFAVLSNDKQEAVFVATASQKGYSVDVSVAKSGLPSGQYDLSLVVGDAFIQNPFQKVVATVSVSSNLAARSQEITYSEPLPEIQHIFRAPEKRPDITISFGFTIAVLAPILVLLVGLFRKGANWRNFPGGATFLSAVGFHAALFGLEGALVLFWFGLPVLVTLKYLALLSIPTVFFGQKVLLHLATPKQKKE